MKIQFLFFFHLIIISFEINENIRKLNTQNKKNSKTKVIIISLVLILILLSLITIYFVAKKLSQNRRNRNNINNQLTKIKIEYLFENILKPKIIKLKLPEILYNECPICLEHIKDKEIICYTTCKHFYHLDCLKNYILSTFDTHCPLCKFDFFSLLEKEDIDFNNINIENINNKKDINYEEILIDNLPSIQHSKIDNSNDNQSINSHSKMNNSGVNNIEQNTINLNNVNNIYNNETFFSKLYGNKEKLSHKSSSEDIISTAIFIKRKDEEKNINEEEINTTKLKIIYTGNDSHSFSKNEIRMKKKNTIIKEEKENENGDDEKEENKKSEEESLDSIEYKKINLKSYFNDNLFQNELNTNQN